MRLRHRADAFGDFIPTAGAPDFGRDVFPLMLAAGERLYGYRLAGDEGFWRVDTPQDYERVRAGGPDLGAGRGRSATDSAAVGPDQRGSEPNA